MSTAAPSVSVASHQAPVIEPEPGIPSESLEMTNLPEGARPTKETQPSYLPSETIDSGEGSSSRTPIVRSETAEVFLGPDGAAPSNVATDSAEAILRISLLLTTGARHPYTISSKYLASRKVTAVDAAGNFDPREMSAYKLKELIWMDWRPEWEPKPRDPSAIRLIIMGRMLEDKSQLKDLPFSMGNTNVLHMTVKPADLLDDEAEGAGKSATKSIRGRGMNDGESAGCCRCVLQ